MPAAALAWAAAVLLIPNAAPPGPAAWWPGVAALAIATAGPGLAAARQHRLPRRRRGARGPARRRRRWVTRVIFEVTVGLAAIGGIVIARTQAGTVDLYASGAPVLVAVLAVIVILRVYQLLVRGLARASARRRGVVGFVGLTRASAATVTLALPALTLVLAVTVASFTGMVRDAVASGETAGVMAGDRRRRGGCRPLGAQYARLIDQPVRRAVADRGAGGQAGRARAGRTVVRRHRR